MGPVIALSVVGLLKLRHMGATYLLPFGQLSSFLLASAAISLSKKSGRAVLGILSFLTILSFFSAWNKIASTQRMENWTRASEYYANNVHEDDGVIFSNGISKHIFAWYQPKALQGFANPSEFVYARRKSQGIAQEEIRKISKEHANIWILDCYTSLGTDIAEIVVEEGFHLSKKERCGPIVFWHWSKQSANNDTARQNNLALTEEL